MLCPHRFYGISKVLRYICSNGTSLYGVIMERIMKTISIVHIIAFALLAACTSCNTTHSIPYLTDGAAGLLDMIGKNFLDSLESKGLNPNKIIVTSVLRTQEDIKKLQKSGNPNAVNNSAHCYATTFDITYARYDKIKFKNFRLCESVEPELLKKVLGEVLRDLRKQNKCYVKYEVRQRCFHITTRI